MPGDFEDLYDLDSMDDAEIAELLDEQFGDYGGLDPDLLDVQVEEGFVTLSGRVGTEEELQLVEQIVTDVLGIANYSNEIVLDELVRAEYAEGADEAATEDAELEAQLGEEGEVTEPSADHLVEDLKGELYGTNDLHDAIQEGKSYHPPDRPPQRGTWSEENH